MIPSFARISAPSRIVLVALILSFISIALFLHFRSEQPKEIKEMAGKIQKVEIIKIDRDVEFRKSTAEIDQWTRFILSLRETSRPSEKLSLEFHIKIYLSDGGIKVLNAFSDGSFEFENTWYRSALSKGSFPQELSS